MGSVQVVLTRWVMLVALAYAIIFSAETVAPLWPHQAFVAAIVVSNLGLMTLLARGTTWARVSGWAAGIDIATLTLAIGIAGSPSPEFYLLYFCVLILAAVVVRNAVLVPLALLAGLCYVLLAWLQEAPGVWHSPEVLVRLPALFGIALYFGTAVQAARREYESHEHRLTLERGRALRALTEMGRVALSGDYPGPVLYEIAGWVQEIVGVDRCSLLLFDEAGEWGYLAASGDDPNVEVLALEVGEYPELEPALETGEPTELHPGRPADLWNEVQQRLPAASPFRSFLVIPVRRGERVIGAFYLRDADGDRSFSDDHLEFVEQAAHMVAAFVHEHDLLQQLRTTRTALREAETT